MGMWHSSKFNPPQMPSHQGLYPLEENFQDGHIIALNVSNCYPIIMMYLEKEFCSIMITYKKSTFKKNMQLM